MGEARRQGTDRLPLGGIHVPLITPLDAEGTVAREALEGLAHGVLDEETAGVVALARTER